MITKPKQEFIKNPIFISYTSLSDFLKCPRSYYLKNIYRNNRVLGKDEEEHEPFRIQLASPHLTLGSTVHDGVKWFLDMEGRASEEQLVQKFRNLWLKFRGKRGGFGTKEDEANFGKRGLSILKNFYKNYQVLGKSALTISFPKYSLGENLVLMGNFDFVEELPDETLHVIDFKTGANDQKDPLQLYIYAILAEANLERGVSKASFWYLDRDDSPREIVLDPLDGKLDWIKKKAFELKKAIEKGEWVCLKTPEKCRDCTDYEAILAGKGQFQFSDFKYKKDVYYLEK